MRSRPREADAALPHGGLKCGAESAILSGICCSTPAVLFGATVTLGSQLPR